MFKCYIYTGRIATFPVETTSIYMFTLFLQDHKWGFWGNKLAQLQPRRRCSWESFSQDNESLYALHGFGARSQAEEAVPHAPFPLLTPGNSCVKSWQGLFPTASILLGTERLDQLLPMLSPDRSPWFWDGVTSKGESTVADGTPILLPLQESSPAVEIFYS